MFESIAEKKLWLWYAIAVLVIIFDQITKQMASSSLDYNQPMAITNFFNFTLRHNTGAAFSLFHDAGGWQRWFFGILAAVFSVFIAVWITRIDRKHWLEALGLALVLGGALGNLYDRILLGYVVDFIHFHYRDVYHFPAFNVADSAISCGAGLLIIDILFFKSDHKSTENKSA